METVNRLRQTAAPDNNGVELACRIWRVAPLEVKVGIEVGAAAGNHRDLLSPRHRLSDRNTERRNVNVSCGVNATVFQHDVTAPIGINFGELDHAVGNSVDRLTGAGGQINAGVEQSDVLVGSTILPRPRNAEIPALVNPRGAVIAVEREFQRRRLIRRRFSGIINRLNLGLETTAEKSETLHVFTTGVSRYLDNGKRGFFKTGSLSGPGLDNSRYLDNEVFGQTDEDAGIVRQHFFAGVGAATRYAGKQRHQQEHLPQHRYTTFLELAFR